MIDIDPFRRRRTVFLLLLAEAAASTTSFVLMYLIKGKFGLDEFALYALVRRASTILTPLMVLGAPLSLVRHVTPQTPAPEAARLICTATMIPTAIAALLTAGALIDPTVPARVVFGSERYAYLVFPLLALSAATGFMLVATGGLRALQRLEQAAIGHIVAFSAIPLAVLLASDSTAGFFYAYAALLLALAIVLISRRYDLRRALPAHRGLNKAFLGFGFKAAAVEALWMLFLFLPPFASAHLESLAASAFHSLALSIVLVAASPLVPLASNQLPRIVASLGPNRKAALALEARRLSRWVRWVALGSVPVSALAIPLATHFMFADATSPGVLEMFMLASSSAAIACYYGLRGIVDVGSSPIQNVRTLCGGIALFALLVGAGAALAPAPASIHVSLAFTFSTMYIGALTAIKAGSTFRRND